MKLFLVLLLSFSGALFAQQTEKPVVILDPGHGGKDQGAKVRNLEEKKLTLRTAYLTKKHLEQLGYTVVMTRARDIFLPLSSRVLRANRRESSVFVSIHYNSAKSPSAKGIEVYYYNKGDMQRRSSSKRLANSILNWMIFETAGDSRGIKQGNFQVIRETVMPGVLIEAGFITNNEERALIATQTYLDKLAKGIAEGVDKYVRGA